MITIGSIGPCVFFGQPFHTETFQKYLLPFQYIGRNKLYPSISFLRLFRYYKHSSELADSEMWLVTESGIITGCARVSIYALTFSIINLSHTKLNLLNQEQLVKGWLIEQLRNLFQKQRF